jgi:hypothetical protein
VCYVIEGSQLGGAVLYQRLAGALAPHPLRYLRGEGGGPGPRWRAIMQALRGAVRTPGEIADACEGACAAFDRMLALAEEGEAGLSQEFQEPASISRTAIRRRYRRRLIAVATKPEGGNDAICNFVESGPGHRGGQAAQRAVAL